MDCSSTPAAPWFALTFRYASHTTCLEIAYGFASGIGSSHRWLTCSPRETPYARPRFRHEFLPLLVDPFLPLNHSTPSLHPHYQASTLLRVDPPLRHASVLSSSWVFHLGLLPWHRDAGSHVPRKSLSQAHATFTPV